MTAEIKAKKDKEEAIIKERERVERERIKELEATKKREENKKHKAKINNEIVDALKSVFYECEKGGEKEREKAIVKAIFLGKIPHVKINY